MNGNIFVFQYYIFQDYTEKNYRKNVQDPTKDLLEVFESRSNQKSIFLWNCERKKKKRGLVNFLNGNGFVFQKDYTEINYSKNVQNPTGDLLDLKVKFFY